MFEETDVDDCTRAFIRTFSAEPWNDRWPSHDRAREYLQFILLSPGACAFVGEAHGTVVGGMIGMIVPWWQGDEYYLREMFVVPEYQGKGAGRLLRSMMGLLSG